MDNPTPSQKWLEYASNDLSWTKSNLNEQVWYGACFTAQQAVEKALKAYLISKDKVIKKIHDLRVLVEECILLDETFEELREECSTINPYYAPARYPDIGDYADFTEEKAKEAYLFAEKIVNFVEKKLVSP